MGQNGVYLTTSLCTEFHCKSVHRIVKVYTEVVIKFQRLILHKGRMWQQGSGKAVQK